MVNLYKDKVSDLLLAALKPDQPARHRLQKHRPQKFMNAIIPPSTMTQEEADLYFGVHTTESFDRAAIYANNFATAENPPVVLTIDTDYYEEHSDIDAKIGMFGDIIRIKLQDRNDIVEAAQNVLSGEEDGDELEALLEEEENYEYGDEDPIMSVSEAIVQDSNFSLSIFNEVYLDDIEKARAILDSTQGNAPEKILAKAGDQYRYKHEIPLVSILKAVKFRPWNDNPITEEEYEAIEDGDEKVMEELDMHYDGSNVIDSEGKIVFSENHMHDMTFGSNPVEGKEIIWTNPQLPLWKPKRIQYHGTTLDKTMEILELVEE